MQPHPDFPPHEVVFFKSVFVKSKFLNSVFIKSVFLKHVFLKVFSSKEFFLQMRISLSVFLKRPRLDLLPVRCIPLLTTLFVPSSCTLLAEIRNIKTITSTNTNYKLQIQIPGFNQLHVRQSPPLPPPHDYAQNKCN